jgi:hypothetical protein
MSRTVRISVSVFVIAMFCLSASEINVFAKKKPKRRRARPTAATPAPLLLVLPPAIVNTQPTSIGLGSVDSFAPKPGPSESESKVPVANATATAGQLIISEFRLSGPGKPGVVGSDAEDEFIEIYNASGASHTVQSSSGSGYAIVASDGVVRCAIPNGDVIANKGHYLCGNLDGFSVASYPDSDPVGPNVNYTTDIPENTGIALFDNNTGNYTLATRIDAVGSSSEANSLYREGAGYPPLTIFNLDYSFVRDLCGKGGNTSNPGGCTQNGVPKDTNNNAADFFFIDTTGTNAGAGQRLGSPGPQANNTPIERNSSVAFNLLDPCVSNASAPNRFRDFTPDPANNSTFGTLDIRRTVTNNTGFSIQRLRFRIIDMTTKPSPAGVADLRVRSSSDIMVTVDRAPCGSGTSNIPVVGTTLADRFLFMGPPFQPQGGGVNALVITGSVNTFSPLPNGASIDLHFLLGVQQAGNYRILVNVEVF